MSGKVIQFPMPNKQENELDDLEEIYRAYYEEEEDFNQDLVDWEDFFSRQ